MVAAAALAVSLAGLVVEVAAAVAATPKQRRFLPQTVQRCRLGRLGLPGRLALVRVVLAGTHGSTAQAWPLPRSAQRVGLAVLLPGALVGPQHLVLGQPNIQVASVDSAGRRLCAHLAAVAGPQARAVTAGLAAQPLQTAQPVVVGVLVQVAPRQGLPRLVARVARVALGRTGLRAARAARQLVRLAQRQRLALELVGLAAAVVAAAVLSATAPGLVARVALVRSGMRPMAPAAVVAAAMAPMAVELLGPVAVVVCMAVAVVAVAGLQQMRQAVPVPKD